MSIPVPVLLGISCGMFLLAAAVARWAYGRIQDLIPACTWCEDGYGPFCTCRGWCRKPGCPLNPAAIQQGISDILDAEDGSHG